MLQKITLIVFYLKHKNKDCTSIDKINESTHHCQERRERGREVHLESVKNFWTPYLPTVTPPKLALTIWVELLTIPSIQLTSN